MYQLGSKAEVLAWVRQPTGEDGPTHVTLTTDAAADLVLHWGVTKLGEGRERRGCGCADAAACGVIGAAQLPERRTNSRGPCPPARLARLAARADRAVARLHRGAGGRRRVRDRV